MILSVLGTWRIEWGPGSIRPDHSMLYMDDCDGEHYIGTFLTIEAALIRARSLKGRLPTIPLSIESFTYRLSGRLAWTTTQSPTET